MFFTISAKQTPFNMYVYSNTNAQNTGFSMDYSQVNRNGYLSYSLTLFHPFSIFAKKMNENVLLACMLNRESK